MPEVTPIAVKGFDQKAKPIGKPLTVDPKMDEPFTRMLEGEPRIGISKTDRGPIVSEFSGMKEGRSTNTNYTEYTYKYDEKDVKRYLTDKRKYLDGGLEVLIYDKKTGLAHFIKIRLLNGMEYSPGLGDIDFDMPNFGERYEILIQYTYAKINNDKSYQIKSGPDADVQRIKVKLSDLVNNSHFQESINLNLTKALAKYPEHLPRSAYEHLQVLKIPVHYKSKELKVDFLFDGLSPEYLQLRQKMVEHIFIGAKDPVSSLLAPLIRQPVAREMQNISESDLHRGENSQMIDSSLQGFGDFSQTPEFSQKHFVFDDFRKNPKGEKDYYSPPDYRQFAQKEKQFYGERNFEQKTNDRKKIENWNANIINAEAKEKHVQSLMVHKKEGPLANISASADAKTQNFKFENAILKTENIINGEILQNSVNNIANRQSNTKAVKMLKTDEMQIKQEAKETSSRMSTHIEKQNICNINEAKTLEEKTDKKIGRITRSIPEKIILNAVDTGKIQENKYNPEKKLIQQGELAKKDEKAPQKKFRMKVKNANKITKMQKKADIREERYAKVDIALAGAKKKKGRDILQIVVSKKRKPKKDRKKSAA